MTKNQNERSAAETEPCVVCSTPSSLRCGQCGLSFCSTHLESSRFAARQLFGPFLVSADELICPPCYGERLWLAWRGLVALITVAATLATLLEGQWWQS